MTIKSKLFILAVLPIVTVLLFSANHLLEKYETLKQNEALIESIIFIDIVSHLLHGLQLERGLSSSYINNQTPYFKDLLTKQKIETDIELKEFISFLNQKRTDFLTISNKFLINDINKIITSLDNNREFIINNKLSANDSFYYYTKLNSQLMELSQDLRLHATNGTYDKIIVLKKLLLFRELAGQERAQVVAFAKDNLDSDGLKNFHYLTESQNKELRNMQSLVQNTKFYSKLNNITNKYKNSYITQIRTGIKENNLKEEIDAKLWIDIATQRIEDYYDLEHHIQSEVEKDIIYKTNTIKIALISQAIITFIIIFLFLLSSYLIANNIQNSLKQLSNGIHDFFDFLDFKSDNPKEIQIDASDELSIMADEINKEIKYLQLNLQNDKDFIKEITQIVTMMKNGNFSQKPYFEPSNPNLIELKNVFNELTELISNKIKEQTKELQILNATLEDEVYYQNLELEQQLLDVTASRDEAVAAEKSKDDFLANMSHEIRTPLNAILGFVTILKKRITEDKDLKYLNIIDSSGNSLLTIINDILDFSKIRSGKFTITPHDIDPMVELSNTTLLFASKAYEKHILYAVYIDPNLPKTISVDDTRVKQILSNILSNAIKFTPHDGIIKVRTLIKNKNLIISVQDSGIGIAKENISKVFSAFEQADGTTTRKYGGTGLGLSISSKLAELMSGKLTLESVEKEGSTFTVEIPVEIVDSSAREFLDFNKIKKYTFAILIDNHKNEIIAKIIKRYLSDFGITNVVELTEYQDHGYDILFFVPSDEYNEEIVDAKIPAIAMLRSNYIKLAKLPHITSLYAPFAPTSVIQAIDDVIDENIQEISKIEDFDDYEVKFIGHVLVAEDNKTNQMLIGIILDDYGIDYIIANDGLEAVDMYREHQFDLILMDENMPNLNGLGAMKLIKEYEAKNNLEATPIVALTANALKSDVEKFFDAGMDGFVAKPINSDILEEEIAKYLKKV